MRLPVVLAVVLALVASADGRTVLKKPKRGFQMRVGDYAIQPGEDLEVCEYRRLPNRKPIDVSAFSLRMPEGAHHFAIWGYGGQIRDDARFPAGPVENVGCTGVSPDDPFPQLLIPTQSPNTELQFPPGVALRLEPRQQVWLNPHMKNFGAEPMRPDIRFNFHRTKRKAVRHWAEALTFGNMTAIRIPPHGEQTITAEWTVPFDLTVVHLSTHQHQLGTYAQIDVVASDGASAETVVVTRDWEHPTAEWFRDGIRLEQGRKLRITCRWRNPGDREVRFGPETTDEMCFGIGFFYRDAGNATPPRGGQCLPARKGLLCPLAPAIAAAGPAPEAAPPPAACVAGGCSGQVCADRPVATTCEWREAYACYRAARCERQPDGACGWTPTAELQACLERARGAR
jgi:eight-cysteine-cluster-containing protein